MPAEINADTNLSDLPAYVRKSFRGSVKKIRLKPGTKIYVLSKKKTIGAGAIEPVNPWWSIYNPFKRDPGYEGRVQFASRSKADLIDVLKDTAAFDGKKAGGRFVVVVKLRVPAWGFYGIIRRKGVSTASARPGAIDNLDRPYQIYIPGLDEHDIRRFIIHPVF